VWKSARALLRSRSSACERASARVVESRDDVRISVATFHAARRHRTRQHTEKLAHLRSHGLAHGVHRLRGRAVVAHEHCRAYKFLSRADLHDAAAHGKRQAVVHTTIAAVFRQQPFEVRAVAPQRRRDAHLQSWPHEPRSSCLLGAKVSDGGAGTKKIRKQDNCCAPGGTETMQALIEKLGGLAPKIRRVNAIRKPCACGVHAPRCRKPRVALQLGCNLAERQCGRGTQRAIVDKHKLHLFHSPKESTSCASCRAHDHVCEARYGAAKTAVASLFCKLCHEALSIRWVSAQREKTCKCQCWCWCVCVCVCVCVCLCARVSVSVCVCVSMRAATYVAHCNTTNNNNKQKPIAVTGS
jgi:hypothetical protein